MFKEINVHFSVGKDAPPEGSDVCFDLQIEPFLVSKSFLCPLEGVARHGCFAISTMLCAISVVQKLLCVVSCVGCCLTFKS